MADPVLEAMDRFSGSIDRLTREAQTTLLSEYRSGWRSISTELEALTAKVASAPRIPIIAGDGSLLTGIPPSWTFQQERYMALQGEVRSLVTNLEGKLLDVTQAGQAGGWNVGGKEALAAGTNLAEIPIRSWASVPSGAFQAFVGGATSGPLSSLLGSFAATNGPQAAVFARDVLGAGLLRGRSAFAIADDLQSGLKTISYSRALTIARTETIRAYREGARQSYVANRTIVQSWAWRAGVENQQQPPCAACFAKHGSLYPISEGMNSHPNCRCRMVPRRSPLLGVSPRNPELLDAGKAFDALAPAQQRRILGPTRLEMYRGGKVNLSDLATSRPRGLWGTNDAALRPLSDLRDLTTSGRALPKLSQKLFEDSARAEANVSATLQQIGQANGADLDGFAFRLKHPGRISEKIEEDVLAGKGDVIQAGGKINDALRYTYKMPEETYSASVESIARDLASRGYTPVKDYKNFWNAPNGYRGYHSLWKTPEGARFELQFHTSQSLEIKQVSHKLYEIQRLASTSAAERAALQVQIDELWAAARFPAGATEIPDTLLGILERGAISSEKLEAMIVRMENELVKNEKFETAVVYEPRTGRIILDKRGEHLGVNFTDEEMAAMRGDVMTHNHPGAYEARARYPDGSLSGGSSFSRQDIDFMLNASLSEMRAVSPAWSHVLRPTETWTGSFENKFALHRSIVNAEDKVRAILEGRIDDARALSNRIRRKAMAGRPSSGTGLSTAELAELKRAADLVESAVLDAQFEHWHEIWKIVQEETRFISYTRTAREARILDEMNVTARLPRVAGGNPIGPNVIREVLPQPTEAVRIFARADDARTYFQERYGALWSGEGASGVRGTEAAAQYSTGGYSWTNARLRGDSLLDFAGETEKMQLRAQAQADLIQTEFDRLMRKELAVVQQDVQVYRGLWERDSSMARKSGGALFGTTDYEALVGKTFTEPAYMSTTVDQATRKYAQAEIQLVLNVGRGTRGLWLNSVSSISGESEFLLNRGLRYTITSAKKVPISEENLAMLRAAGLKPQPFAWRLEATILP